MSNGSNNIQRRRWLGLIALVVLVFLLARVGGWFAARRTVVELQRQVVQLVNELDGHYYYDYQLVQANSSAENLLDHDSPAIRKHPLAAVFGDDWFHDVFYVTFAQFDGVPEDRQIAIRSEIGDAQIAPLLQLPQLKWLALSGTAVTDQGVVQLATLPNLQRLWLGGTQITDRAIQSVGHCESLTHLAIEGTATSDAGLAQIAALPHLKFLSLGSPYISADGLSRLGQTSTLEELHVDRLPVGERALQAFENLLRLRVLSLRMTPVTDEGIGRLGKLTQLEQLYLDGTLISDAALNAAQAWKNLHTLSLAYTSITDAGLQKLEECRKLKSLDLTQCNCSLNGISELFKVRQTRSWEEALGLVFNTKLNSQGALTSLDLSPLRVSDADMHALLPLTELQWLIMPNSSLTDAGIETLLTVPWKQLTLLRIDNSNITDHGLELLGRLPALRTLHIANTKVSPAAIDRLSDSKVGLRVYLNQLEPLKN